MRRWLTGLLLFLCATGIADEKKVTIDFPGVEIEAFLKWVGIQTGKRFIYGV